MQKIIVRTLFDITATDILRNYKPAYLIKHSTIKTEKDWIKARKQQQNWETVMQLISLRANPMFINKPITRKVKLDEYGYHMFGGQEWMFYFEVESNDVFRSDNDPVGLLKEDFKNVPMISGLKDDVVDCEYFRINEPQINVLFKVVEIAL